jgi:hypothetical protein
MKPSDSGNRPTVHAIAALLADTDPQILNGLHERYPEQRHLFDPAYVLGDKPVEAVPLMPREAEALRAFVEVGLA